MKVRRRIRQLSLAGTVSIFLILGILGHRSVNAQFVDCVHAGSSAYHRWGDINRDISIGREIYTSVAYIQPGREGQYTVTCRLNPTPGTTFSYAVGFNDTDSDTPPAELLIYLNGGEESRQTIRHGQLYTKMVNTSGARSISIEAICTRSSGCRKLWFVQLGADSPRSPGSR